MRCYSVEQMPLAREDRQRTLRGTNFLSRRWGKPAGHSPGGEPQRRNIEGSTGGRRASFRPSVSETRNNSPPRMVGPTIAVPRRGHPDGKGGLIADAIPPDYRRPAILGSETAPVTEPPRLRRASGSTLQAPRSPLANVHWRHWKRRGPRTLAGTAIRPMARRNRARGSRGWGC